MLLSTGGFADVVIPLNYVFSGSASSPPYLTATFTDLPEGGVQLDLNAGSSVYVSDWAFNISDPTLLSGLTFTFISSTPRGDVTNSGTVTTGSNFYKADGDGSYDIRFSFPTDSGSRFLGGTTQTYVISGEGVTAQDFYAKSQPGSNSTKGPFYSAAQVQGGAWIGAQTATVPEPTPYPLYSAVMLALCAGIFQRIRSRAR